MRGHKYKMRRRLCSLFLILTMTAVMLPLCEIAADASEKIEAAGEAELPSDLEEAVPEIEEQQSAGDTGSISGTVWLDRNENGLYDSGEVPVAGYEVSLYAVSDKTEAVQRAVTDDNGEYTFEDLVQNDYVVGIPLSQTVNETKYLVPLTGVSGDNKFALDKTTYDAYTKFISIAEGAEAVAYDAGVRLPPGMQSASVEIEPGAVYEVDNTAIGFAGHEWWIIGDASSGVLGPRADSLTLFSRYQDFEREVRYVVDLSVPDTGRYSGSNVHGYMTEFDTSLFTSGNDRESNYVISRESLDMEAWDFDTNTNVGDIHGYGVLENQKFWPLSVSEFKVINNDDVKEYYPHPDSTEFIPWHFWLRSPGASSLLAKTYVTGIPIGDTIWEIGNRTGIMSIRPAFYLDAATVLFTSAANGGTMKQETTTAGSPDLVTTTSPADVIKLTMEDNDNLGLTTTTELITSSAGATRTFDYSGAHLGADKTVSMMILDIETEEAMFYGRVVDLDAVGAESSGDATFTVPASLTMGDYLVKVFNEKVNGENYTDYASTPQEFILRITNVDMELSADPAETKVYDDSVDITALVTNYLGGPSTIEDVDWFRVPISDTTDYSTTFDTTYAAAASVHKGTITDPGLSESSQAFILTTDKNATYWFKGTVRDGINTFTIVKKITVDNIYQLTPVSVRGEIDGSSPVQYLYNYEEVSGTYGIPYDLDGSTILSLARLGYDTVTIDAKSEYTSPNWVAAMKSTTAVPLTITLDHTFPNNSECDGGDETKYTIVYRALTTSLKIGKTVTGDYGDPNKAFEVTITLLNSGTAVSGTYSYTGSAISGVTAPANGTITFDAAGKGMILLKHGQAITIAGLIQGHTYTVQETDAAVSGGLYEVDYSGDGTISGSGAGASISQTLGSAQAVVSITNDRSSIPTSGLSGMDYRAAAIGFLMLLAAVLVSLWGYRRRKLCS